MSYNIGDTLTQADINGLISVFCQFYEYHETFDYASDLIEFDNVDLQIQNGIYSDEELISESPLKVKISNETFPNQRYIIGFDYYSYEPDSDDDLPELKRDYFDLEPDSNGVAEVEFDDDVLYIKLENWELVTKFDKPVIMEAS
jgi:hypothetical protein